MSATLELCYCTDLGVAIMTRVNHLIQEFSEHFIALLISSDTAHRHDEGVTRIVDT